MSWQRASLFNSSIFLLIVLVKHGRTLPLKFVVSLKSLETRSPFVPHIFCVQIMGSMWSPVSCKIVKLLCIFPTVISPVAVEWLCNSWEGIWQQMKNVIVGVHHLSIFGVHHLSIEYPPQIRGPTSSKSALPLHICCMTKQVNKFKSSSDIILDNSRIQYFFPKPGSICWNHWVTQK